MRTVSVPAPTGPDCWPTAVLDLAELVPVHGVRMAPVDRVRVHEHGERPAPVPKPRKGFRVHGPIGIVERQNHGTVRQCLPGAKRFDHIGERVHPIAARGEEVEMARQSLRGDAGARGSGRIDVVVDENDRASVGRFGRVSAEWRSGRLSNGQHRVAANALLAGIALAHERFSVSEQMGSAASGSASRSRTPPDAR